MEILNSGGFPWVILHNTITLDGSVRGFEADLDIHYRTAASFAAQGYLVGSQTVIDAFSEIPEEQDDNYVPEIDPDDKRPYWIVVDSKGRLQDYLNHFRKMEYIKDIILLISGVTPREYVQFLKKRKFPYIQVGEAYVNYRKAFLLLRKKYGINRLLTDTGITLNNELFGLGLINAVSLLIAPQLIAEGDMRIFSGIKLTENNLRVKLHEVKKLENDYVWLNYQIRS